MNIISLKNGYIFELPKQYRKDNTEGFVDNSNIDKILRNNKDVINLKEHNIESIRYYNKNNELYDLYVIDITFYNIQNKDNIISKKIFKGDNILSYNLYKKITIVDIQAKHNLEKNNWNILYNELCDLKLSTKRRTYIITIGHVNNYIKNKDSSFPINIISKIIKEDNIYKYKVEDLNRNNKNVLHTNNEPININKVTNNQYNVNKYISDLKGKTNNIICDITKYRLNINDGWIKSFYIDNNIESLILFFITINSIYDDNDIKQNIKLNIFLIDFKSYFKNYNDYIFFKNIIKAYILHVIINSYKYDKKYLNNFFNNIVLKSNFNNTDIKLFKNRTKKYNNLININNKNDVKYNIFNFFSKLLYKKDRSLKKNVKKYIIKGEDQLFLNLETVDDFWEKNFNTLKVEIINNDKKTTNLFSIFKFFINLEDLNSFINLYLDFYKKNKKDNYYNNFNNLNNLYDEINTIINNFQNNCKNSNIDKIDWGNINHIYWNEDSVFLIKPELLDNIYNHILKLIQQANHYMSDNILLDFNYIFKKDKNDNNFKSLPINIYEDSKIISKNNNNERNNFNFGFFIINGYIDFSYLIKILIDNYFEELVPYFIPRKIKNSEEYTDEGIKKYIYHLKNNNWDKASKLSIKMNLPKKIKYNESMYNILFVVFNREVLDPDRYDVFLFDRNLLYYSMSSSSNKKQSIEIADILIYDNKHNNIFFIHNKFSTSEIHHISNQISVSSYILKNTISEIESLSNIKENHTINSIWDIIINKSYNCNYLLNKKKVKSINILKENYYNILSILKRNNIYLIAGIGSKTYYSYSKDFNIYYKDSIQGNWLQWKEENYNDQIFIKPLTLLPLYETIIEHKDFNFLIKRINTINL